MAPPVENSGKFRRRQLTKYRRELAVVFASALHVRPGGTAVELGPRSARIVGRKSASFEYVIVRVVVVALCGHNALTALLVVVAVRKRIGTLLEGFVVVPGVGGVVAEGVEAAVAAYHDVVDASWEKFYVADK